VSDGLMGDLAKLCAASGVAADIEATAIPLSAAASAVLDRGAARLESLVSGGDDYEVLCTVAPSDCAAFVAAAAAAGVTVTPIGVVTAGSAPPRLIDVAGGVIALSHRSYSHF
jgi:thiamine-monophosphate kinase